MVNPFQDTDDRVVEATPARRRRAIERGEGPRAPWLAAAVSGLLSLALLSIAAGPVAAEAKAWIRHSLQAPEADSMPTGSVMLPAVACALAVLVACVAGQSIAQGGLLRLGAWRAATRATWGRSVRSAMTGWVLGAAALAGGVVGVLPWIGALPQLGQRPLHEGLWAVGAFAASAALGALLAALVLGLVQLRLAGQAFDRTLRMTRAEAREAAKEDSVRQRLPRPRWRLA